MYIKYVIEKYGEQYNWNKRKRPPTLGDLYGNHYISDISTADTIGIFDTEEEARQHMPKEVVIDTEKYNSYNDTRTIWYDVYALFAVEFDGEDEFNREEIDVVIA